jgi:hypothetical protein
VSAKRYDSLHSSLKGDADVPSGVSVSAQIREKCGRKSAEEFLFGAN